MAFSKWVYFLIIPSIMYYACIRPATNHRIESDTEWKRRKKKLHHKFWTQVMLNEPLHCSCGSFLNYQWQNTRKKWQLLKRSNPSIKKYSPHSLGTSHFAFIFNLCSKHIFKRVCLWMQHCQQKSLFETKKCYNHQALTTLHLWTTNQISIHQPHWEFWNFIHWQVSHSVDLIVPDKQ